MPRLLQNERERAVEMFQAGMTQTEIANHFNCSRMTIYRLLVRVRATGTTSDRRRSGRPRETMLRHTNPLTQSLCYCCGHTRRTSGIRNNIISDQIVRNRLRQSGLRSRRPRHRIARLQWARTRLRWRRNTWQNILLSVESKFSLKFSDGRVRIFIVVVGNVSLIWRRWCNGMGWN